MLYDMDVETSYAWPELFRGCDSCGCDCRDLLADAAPEGLGSKPKKAKREPENPWCQRACALRSTSTFMFTEFKSGHRHRRIHFWYRNLLTMSCTLRVDACTYCFI